MPRNISRYTGLFAHAGLQRARERAHAAAAKRAAELLAAQGERGDRHLIHVDDTKLVAIRRVFVPHGRSVGHNPVTGLESFAPGDDVPADENAVNAPDSDEPSPQSVRPPLPDGSSIGEQVRLPNGQPVDYRSPTADLTPVANAGRQTGDVYWAMQSDPEQSAAALPFLASKLALAFLPAGKYDYQREGLIWPLGELTGYKQFPQFRPVSNFNIGLYFQQAGLPLEDALSITGNFARQYSPIYAPDQPYGLPPENRKWITEGYAAGRSGGFGAPAAPPQRDDK